MSTFAYRLKSMKIGDIPDDGTMATVLNQLFHTYKGTVSLIGDAPTSFDVMSEELDDPEASFAKKGKYVLKFSLFVKDNETKLIFLGGQIVNGWWEAPNTAPIIEKSVQLITQSNYIIQMPRVSFVAVESDEFKEDGVGLIEVTGTILPPAGAGVKSRRSRQYQNPTVSAGNAQNITVANAALAGTATAFVGTIVSQQWSCISKPVAAADPTIATPAALNTNVTGLVNGVYRFQLAAKDENDFESKATVMVTVALP
ncbi:hypothetical protein AB6735_18735 [Mucilaginibacter sp. RCC_168]|uniref:PKD domain-containing protein n=1 Tax=Mucilaginibacter sp. RCC_168 TaxID=3239221 RepID=UPI00352680B2